MTRSNHVHVLISQLPNIKKRISDPLRLNVKLAHTIADLGSQDEIQPTHLAEALQYRPKGMIG